MRAEGEIARRPLKERHRLRGVPVDGDDDLASHGESAWGGARKWKEETGGESGSVRMWVSQSDVARMRVGRQGRRGVDGSTSSSAAPQRPRSRPFMRARP